MRVGPSPPVLGRPGRDRTGQMPAGRGGRGHGPPTTALTLVSLSLTFLARVAGSVTVSPKWCSQAGLGNTCRARSIMVE